MPKQATPDHLSKEKKIWYQRKLSYFLKRYRFRNNLQSKEMAEKLGYTPTRYGQLESETNPHPRFIGAINFLNSIFGLEPHMNLTEFVNFLEGQTQRVEDDGVTLKRSLHSWEKSLLMALDPMDRSIRDKFISECRESVPGNHKLLEAKIALLNSLSGFPEEKIDAARKLIELLREP